MTITAVACKKRLSLFASFLLFAIAVFAQPAHIHLGWNKTGRHTTENTLSINWSDTRPVKAVVRYGIDANLKSSHQASVAFSSAADLYMYKSDLRKLKAATTYYYQCGSEETGWSPVYTFVTAPKHGSNEKFVVGVWGDTQDNEFNTSFEKTTLIVDQLKKYPLQFTIHMGDIVENGAHAARWKGLFKTTEPINAVAPFMPVTGNHDVNNDTASATFQQPFPVFYDFLHLPRNSTDYSFDYGNTHFVAISSGHAKGAENMRNWRYAKGSPEYKWLDADLSGARKNKKVKWIIIYMHHPLYSFGWSHVEGWQERITPLIDKYRVDLALAGHRHVYERHRPIRNNIVQAITDSHVYHHPAGTVYVTNGTAGGSPQGIGGKDMPSMIFTSAAKMYNYAVMTIDGKAISYEVFNERGEKVDYFRITSDKND